MLLKNTKSIQNLEQIHNTFIKEWLTLMILQEKIIQTDLQFLIIHIDINKWQLWIRKINALLNLIIHQPEIDKTFLYFADWFEVKCQLLINKREIVCLKHCNDPKGFLPHSYNMNDIYESIDECNTKKIKLLIVFNDKIAGTLSYKKLHSVVTVSYIKQKKKKKNVDIYHIISFCCTKKY